MIVAPREQRTDEQTRGRIGTDAAPAQDRALAMPAGENFLSQAMLKTPGRPGHRREGSDTPPAFGVLHIRGIALRAQKDGTVSTLQPGFDAVDQNHAARRRRR